MPALAAQSNASERLAAISARLKAEGQKGLRLEMNRTLRASAQPLVAAVRDAARAQLPKSGGLNEQQATQAITVSVLNGARTAGVRLRTKRRGSLQTNRGYVRHPVFADGEKTRDEWKWVTQQIPQAAGWWTNTLAAKSAEVTTLIVAELNRVGRIIQGGY